MAKIWTSIYVNMIRLLCANFHSKTFWKNWAVGQKLFHTKCNNSKSSACKPDILNTLADKLNKDVHFSKDYHSIKRSTRS